MSLLKRVILLAENRIISFKKNNGNFIVIIGGPGSGKSKVAKNLISLNNYKIIDSDRFLELWAKKNNLDLKDPDNTYKAKMATSKIASNYKKNLIDNLLSNKKQNYLFDNTGRKIEEIKEMTKKFDDLGYETTLIYVDVEISKALKRNQSRTRVVPNEVVIEIHKKIKENLQELSIFFKNIWYVNNSEDNLLHFRNSNNIKKIK